MECYHYDREWYHIYASIVKHYDVLKAKTRPDKSLSNTLRSTQFAICNEKHSLVNRHFFQLFTNMTMKSLYVRPLILEYTN